MIKRISVGNILESKAQTLVNTVNVVGVMGKGIALEFKNRFPEMYKDYKIRCDKGEVVLRKPYLFKRLFEPWIINFPTKEHWRSVSRIEDIKNGLIYLIDHYKEWGVKSLAIPPLGCGNGQLEWEEVGPIIYQALNRIDIPVELYAPFGTPAEHLTPMFLDQSSLSSGNIRYKSSKLNPNWLVMVEILNELEKNTYNTPVGRTIFQKISYVATASGVPTNLNFQQSSYGPFSNQLKQVITILANNGLVVEEKKGQMFKLRVGHNFEKLRLKYKDEIEQYKNIIDQTADLFARMTTDQAEITTTIFFSSKELKKKNGKTSISEKDILEYILEWKKRRRPPLDTKEVATAIRNLAMLKWLKVDFSPDLPVVEEF
ncbi:MAG: macro domain-containing protein [Calditrichaceae bacterium]|nr:macro domain-containing protein [Calditrichaceae bacterium]